MEERVVKMANKLSENPTEFKYVGMTMTRINKEEINSG
jgi:hypothetical protein